MTAYRPQLVRPRVLTASAIVFALLVPFVIHAAWDYAETWRLGKSIAAIRADHEPLTTQEIHSAHILDGEAADSARYYRAAAALAGSDAGATSIRARVTEALWSDEWPQALVGDLRDRVARDDDAFRLLDHATPLAFDGFGPGNLNARIAEMLTLARLASLRTRLLAIEGDGNGAVASLYAELRLQRTFDFDPVPSYLPGVTIAGLADSVGLIINRSRPDGAALARLAAPLRELDRDDRLKRRLLRMRAAIFDNRLDNWSLWRPWMLKLLNERIETLGALIEGAGRPWPRPLDPPSGAYLPDSASERLFREMDRGTMATVAIETAFIRCARSVVAVERYRLDHAGALSPRIEDLAPAYLDASPIDPFSGRPLRFVATSSGYIVYSVGRDRRDQGGRLARRDSPDLGIRIARR